VQLYALRSTNVRRERLLFFSPRRVSFRFTIPSGIIRGTMFKVSQALLFLTTKTFFSSSWELPFLQQPTSRKDSPPPVLALRSEITNLILFSPPLSPAPSPALDPRMASDAYIFRIGSQGLERFDQPARLPVVMASLELCVPYYHFSLQSLPFPTARLVIHDCLPPPDNQPIFQTSIAGPAAPICRHF